MAPAKPMLTDVLHNKTVGGFSRESLATYLRMQEAETVLEFWVVIQDYYNVYEPENVASTYSKFQIPIPKSYVEVTEADREKRKKEKLEEALLIFATYCTEDAPLPVPLSPECRSNIIEKMPGRGNRQDSTTAEAPVELFNEAQTAARDIIKTKYFEGFLQAAPKLHKKLKSKLEVFHAPHAPKPKGQVNVVKLHSVLHNNTVGGFSRNQFMEFLEQKFCESLLEFWIVVQDYWDTHEPTCEYSTFVIFNIPVPKPSKRKKKSRNDREKKKFQAAKEIVQTYILEESALEVNISAKQRKNIEKSIPLDKADAVVPYGIFMEAQNEVFNLLETNYFQEFLVHGQKKFEIQSSHQVGIFTPRPPSTTFNRAGSVFESSASDDVRNGSFSSQFAPFGTPLLQAEMRDSLGSAISFTSITSFVQPSTQARIQSIRLRKEVQGNMRTLERVKFKKRDLVKKDHDVDPFPDKF